MFGVVMTRILYAKSGDYILPFTEVESFILTMLRLHGPSTFYALSGTPSRNDDDIRTALRSLVRCGMVSKHGGLFKLED